MFEGYSGLSEKKSKAEPRQGQLRGSLSNKNYSRHLQTRNLLHKGVKRWEKARGSAGAFAANYRK